MSIYFIKSGLQTSIQDFGRTEQMHHGISKSGAMDIVAMQMANWLVSKPLDSPLIEITMVGPSIRFTSNLSIAFCGAKFECRLNGKKVKRDRTIQVFANDILEFKKCRSGLRAYLAFSAEITTDSNMIKPVMNSYSTHLTAGFGGYKGRAFQDNDLLELNKSVQNETRTITNNYRITYSGSYLLRSVASVETTAFSKEQKDVFYGQSYNISTDSNRMGIRLSGKPIFFKQQMQITSTGLTQGSIQIPPDGQPIVSSVDGQTLGGYPRIANVISADLPILGQLKPNDHVRFSLINNAQAMEIYKEKQDWLEQLFSSFVQ